MKLPNRLLLTFCAFAFSVGTLVSAQEQTKETKTTAHEATWNQIQAKMHAIFAAKPSADMKGLVPTKPEAPNSPKYFYLNKTEAAKNAGNTKTQDGKTFQKGDFFVPGNIISVSWSCAGPGDSCQHTFNCDAACGANQSMADNNHYIWFTKTDDGNETLYTFVIHFEKP
jgi:hypothetical protein